MSAEYDNDELVFLDEDSHQELDDKNKRQWNILIVDDISYFSHAFTMEI